MKTNSNQIIIFLSYLKGILMKIRLNKTKKTRIDVKHKWINRRHEIKVFQSSWVTLNHSLFLKFQFIRQYFSIHSSTHSKLFIRHSIRLLSKITFLITYYYLGDDTCIHTVFCTRLVSIF